MTKKELEVYLLQLKLKVAQLLGLQKVLKEGGLLPLVARKRDEFISACAAAGSPIIIMSQYRSCAEQDALYAQGRTKPGNIVTNAKCGQSLHNYGVAFDVAFKSATPYVGNWEKIGKIGESLGLEWGNRWENFPDKPHFQLMLGYTLSDFQNKRVDYKKYL